MSIRHSDKCTKKEAQEFRAEVKKWCDENKIPYTKMIASTAYEGVVRIYNGMKVPLMSQRRRKKLVAFKNSEGEWEGDLEAVELYGGQGDALYLFDYHSKQKPVYTSVYRDEWNDSRYQEDEKKAIKDFFGIK